ncbi:MAG: TetR family transcriptional regulator [Nitrospirales bacterium]|nr:MAG: TetR family transcriptional regulator [Nitrospirales bacterium]
MPITKVNENELLDRLTDVFRTYGYEGASLSKISEVTGLQRASLYHRFPGGKEDMAKAVLERAGQWLTGQVLAPLSEPGKPADRIRHMAKELHSFYAGGKHCCLLDSLSFGSDDSDIRQHVQQGMSEWVDKLAKVVREAGVSSKNARQHAQDAISHIQGTLVVARVMKDYGPFERMLSELPTTLLRKKS